MNLDDLVEIPQLGSVDYDVVLGESFFEGETENKSLRYDFLPRSVVHEEFKPHYDQFGKGVRIKHRDTREQDVHFLGHEKKVQDTEFVLIFKGGKFVLEKLHRKVISLKQQSGSSVVSNVRKRKRAPHEKTNMPGDHSMFQNKRRKEERSTTKILHQAPTSHQKAASKMGKISKKVGSCKRPVRKKPIIAEPIVRNRDTVKVKSHVDSKPRVAHTVQKKINVKPRSRVVSKPSVVKTTKAPTSTQDATDATSDGEPNDLDQEWAELESLLDKAVVSDSAETPSPQIMAQTEPENPPERLEREVSNTPSESEPEHAEEEESEFEKQEDYMGDEVESDYFEDQDSTVEKSEDAVLEEEIMSPKSSKSPQQTPVTAAKSSGPVSLDGTPATEEFEDDSTSDFNCFSSDSEDE